MSSQVPKDHPCSTFINKPCETYPKQIHFSPSPLPAFASLRGLLLLFPGPGIPSPHTLLVRVSLPSFGSLLKPLFGEVAPSLISIPYACWFILGAEITFRVFVLPEPVSEVKSNSSGYTLHSVLQSDWGDSSPLSQCEVGPKSLPCPSFRSAERIP